MNASTMRRLVPYAFVAGAAAYVLAAVAAVIVLSVRVPYADAWQHYADLLAMPFPANIFDANNGHAEVFANLVRLASLRWFRGSETPQIAVGLALALTSYAIILSLLCRPLRGRALYRAAIACTLAIGLFWLGNGRALLHDNESLHVYSVFVCLAAAITILLHETPAAPPTSARVGLAAIACAVAAFCFGSGIAAFLAVAAVLFVRRASLAQWAMLGAALVITLGLYRLLPGSGGVPVWLDPLSQVPLALHWLASPLVYLFWPFVDPAAAAALPAPIDALGAIARAWAALAGDIRLSVLPQALAGAAFVAGLMVQTWRARRDPGRLHAIGCAGLALAWFAIGVAALIAMTRLDYFRIHPDQIQAPRYLPWSSLGWAGLLVAALGRRAPTRLPLVLAAALPFLALAAEGGMALAMHHQREAAEDVALGAVVGVWFEHGNGGETDAEVVQRAARAMRPLGLGPFAWPEASMIGARVPTDARPVVVSALHASPAQGGERIEAQVMGVSCAPRHLLVERGGMVAGLLRPLAHGRWSGAVRSGSGAVSVYALCRD